MTMYIENEIYAKKEYYNELNIRDFCKVFEKTTACYKYYWLDAILTLLQADFSNRLLSFDAIFDEMIFQCWYTRAFYKLRLGYHTGAAGHSDALEEAIDLLSAASDLVPNCSEEQIKIIISRNQSLISGCKKTLEKYVPKRFLMPFTHHKSDSYKTIMSYVDLMFENGEVPYRIVAINKSFYIEIHENWVPFFVKEYTLLKRWIAFEKCAFLQKCNPEVPGIIYKLTYDPGTRNLSRLRKLWDAVIPSGEVIDLFTKNEVEEEHYALDHFIPWSFISNNELWNICPIDPGLNGSKSNQLPPWKYAESLGKCQYILYKHLNLYKTDKVIRLFHQCEGKHLCADWAARLFSNPADEEQFINEILAHLEVYYKSAYNLGYSVWDYQTHS